MFAKFKAYIALIAGALWAASVAAAFFYGEGVGQDRADAREAREQALVRTAVDAANKAAAGAIAQIEIKHTTIRQEVQREIIKEPVYRECRHSPDGLRGLNDALGAGGVSPRGGELPRTDTAR